MSEPAEADASLWYSRPAVIIRNQDDLSFQWDVIREVAGRDLPICDPDGDKRKPWLDEQDYRLIVDMRQLVQAFDEGVASTSREKAPP